MLRLLVLSTIVAGMVPGQQRDAIRVRVTVDGGSSVKTVLSSLIHRELRKLTDVVIVENSPQFTLSFVALEQYLTSSQSQRPVGLAVSTVVFRHMIDVTQLNRLEDNTRLVLKIATEGQGEIVAHRLIIGGMPIIDELARRIVANIDVGEFELYRKSIQYYRENSGTNPEK